MSLPKLLLALLLFKFLLLGVGGLPLYKFFRGEFDFQTAIDYMTTNLILLLIALAVIGFIYYLYSHPARPPNSQD